MARGINKVILIGNLGRDPETRASQGGTPVTNFSLATSDTWKDKQSGEQQERTEWHNVVCFARVAEIAGQYLKKGSKVYIEGSLRTSSWEQDGQKKYRTEVMCRDLQMLDGRPDANSPNYVDRGQQPEQQSVPALAEDDFEDDIPFAWILGIPFLPELVEVASASQNLF